MVRGEISVWKKGNYRPFCVFIEIESDSQLRTLELSGTQGKLKCRIRSDRPDQLTCIVDLEETPSERGSIFFEFKNLPVIGRSRVRGRIILGRFTSWLCTFTNPDQKLRTE